MNHYYTDNSELNSERKEFTYYFDNEVFRFTTDNGVFSKNNVDYGTYILIRSIYRKDLGHSLLDLGSGYGPIGIILKRFHPETEVSAKQILKLVYEAMQEKGYNPVSQIVGYIMSGDPTYITSHNGARSLIMKAERDDLVEELLKAYVQNRSWEEL